MIITVLTELSLIYRTYERFGREQLIHCPRQRVRELLFVLCSIQNMGAVGIRSPLNRVFTFGRRAPELRILLSLFAGQVVVYLAVFVDVLTRDETD